MPEINKFKKVEIEDNFDDFDFGSAKKVQKIQNVEFKKLKPDVSPGKSPKGNLLMSNLFKK